MTSSLFQRVRALAAPARHRRRSRRGMSLVEVMVVIAIILTLMSVLALGVWQVFGESQGQTTRLTMGKVAQRIEIYMLRKKKPPSSGDGLGAVYGNEKIPQDAWGNDFLYVAPGPNGKPFDLISLGADGQQGGSGNDEDIHYAEEGAE